MCEEARTCWAVSSGTDGDTHQRLLTVLSAGLLFPLQNCVWHFHTSQPPHHPCFSKDTHHHAHTLPLLASVHSLCPVWERLRHLKSHGLQPVFNSLWLPWVKFRLKHPSLTASFPQNKSLQSCISHRLILACFEVSELTWKQGCFGSLCEGLAVHTISDTQNVKALTGRAAWGDPKLEPDRVEAK